MFSTLLRLGLVSQLVMLFSVSAWADTPEVPEAPEASWVALMETDDSLCLAHGGKLISLRLTDTALPDQAGAVEVWVDRWFMQVQTADHTRHLLTADEPEKELGCSHSLAGPQHWTVSSIKRVPASNASVHKETP